MGIAVGYEKPFNKHYWLFCVSFWQKALMTYDMFESSNKTLDIRKSSCQLMPHFDSLNSISQLNTLKHTCSKVLVYGYLMSSRIYAQSKFRTRSRKFRNWHYSILKLNDFGVSFVNIRSPISIIKCLYHMETYRFVWF